MLIHYARRAQEFLIDQLKKGTSPQGLALSCTMGVICGSFPVLGFCTILSLIFSLFFELNQPTLQLVNQLMWPVHLLMIPVFIYSGEFLLGMEHIPLRPDLILEQFSNDPRQFVVQYSTAVLAAVFAWALTAPIFGYGCYYAFKKLFLKLKRKKSPH